MTKQQEFRKQTEEAKFEAFSFMCKKVVNLEKKNAELKEKVNILNNCDRLGDMITEAYKDQLTKAKEIIKKFSEFANLEVEYDSEHPQEHTDLWNELCKEAEQFLMEE